jgi:hypothetical protein
MRREARPRLVSALALLCLLGHCQGQGTMTITFEGPPAQPPGTVSYNMQYSESGMWFTCPGHPFSVLLVGSGLAGDPDNGTTYLGTLLNTTIVVSSLSGVQFGFTSFDVAQFQGLLTPPKFQVLGFRGDGTRVTNDFTNLSNNFQTVQLGSEFAGLNTVHLTGGFAFDNVVISGVPEPSAGALALLGAACAFWFRRLRRRHYA